MGNILILIRHSLPELDASVPPKKWLLNEKGKEQARLLARHLLTHSIRRVMSSSEPKAIETAQIVATYLCLTTEIVPGLHEHERPLTKLTSEAHYKKTIARLFSEPDKLTFGSETANEAGERFERTIQNLLWRYPDQGLAIVSHGTVMSKFAANHSNVDPHTIWQRIGLPGALIFSRPQTHLTARLSPVH